MLKHLYSPHILRNLDGSEGGTPTRIEAPAKEPIVLKGGNDAPLPPDIDDQTFDLSSFEPEQLPPQPETKKTEEPKAKEAPKAKPQEQPKVEPKKVAPITPPVQKQQPVVKPPIKPVQPITPPIKKVEDRDYSGFSNEEVTVLKQMSNPAFEFASKLIKENKQLAGLKNATYLQHERAYTLDPQYHAKQSEVSDVEKEAQYWQQQLVLLREGKDAREMIGWDKNGNMVFGNTIKPSVQTEELIRTAMNNCVQTAANLKAELRNFPTQYKNQISNDLKAIEQTNKEMFSWESDAKLLDYEMEVEGIGTRSIKQIKEDFKNMLPPWMQSHPLVNVCGNLMASLRIGQAYLAQAQQGQQVQQTINDEAEHKEPTSKAKEAPVTKGKEIHGVTEFSMDEFKV